MLVPPLVAAMLACKPVTEVPADLDGAMHFLWQGLDEGGDADLVAGVASLHRALGGDTLAEATDGSVSRLTQAEIEPLGLSDRDPAAAAGVFMGNLVPCDAGVLIEILTWPEQADLYAGVYEAYERSYQGEIDAFLGGSVDSLGWDVDYEAKILGSTYWGHTEAMIRRVRAEALEDEELPFEAAYLVRYYSPEPAEFEEGSEKSFDQDYQFELYWDRGGGEILHAYAIWREANWGAGFTSEDEGVQRLMLNGMEDWDEDTAAICAAGGP